MHWATVMNHMKTKNHSLLLYIMYVCGSILLLPTLSLSQDAPSTRLDLDGDGISEIVGLEVQSDGSPNELVYYFYNTVDGTTTSKEFGSSADKPALADYDGDGKVDIAVVAVKDDTNDTTTPSDTGTDTTETLLWKIIPSSDENGDTIEIEFGKVGDYILSGCDLDGDSKSELILIRKKELMFRTFENSEITTYTLPFKPKDVTCGKRGENGEDHIFILSKKNKKYKRQIIYEIDLNNGEFSSNEVRTLSKKKFAGLLVFDGDGDGTADLGYFRKKIKKTKVVMHIDDNTKVKKKIARVDKLTVGSYRSDTSQEGFIIEPESSSGFMLYDHLGSDGTNVSISGADTIIKAVSYQKTTGSTSGENCDVNRKAPDGGGGFLWKPISDTTGNLVVLTPGGEDHQNARLVKDGKVIESLYLSSKANPDANGLRNHFRASKPGASYPDGLTFMTVLNNKTHCWLITDTSERID